MVSLCFILKVHDKGLGIDSEDRIVKLFSGRNVDKPGFSMLNILFFEFFRKNW
ncbi:hypothetical protein SRABI96_00148 [Peribacillus sp. Bi96]|nr:hypothetical protein SRABI96_00148 [Peribacillus sp. Bi96]